MGDYFFGKNNIEQLCIQLENKLPIKKTVESRRSCRRFLEEQMRVVYDKYGNKRPEKMPIPVFINKLNEKSLGECIKAYEERSGKKINLQKKPSNQGQPQQRKGRTEFSAMTESSDNTASFASLKQGNGFFISATGEMGGENEWSRGSMQNNNRDYSRGENDPELEQRMMERQMEYGRRGGFGNERPPEINFALDGGDSRHTNMRKEMQDMQNQTIEGFGSMEGGFGGSSFTNNMGGMFGTGMTGSTMIMDNGMNNMNNMNGMNNMSGINSMSGMNSMNGMNSMSGMNNNLNMKMSQLMNERGMQSNKMNPMMQNNMMQNNMMQNNMMQNPMMQNQMMNNPMMQNNMMNNQNNMFGNSLNFRQGGDTSVSVMNTTNDSLSGKGLPNDIQNMNSTQIQRLINSMKIETNNLNPQVLQKMDSRQIEEMIEQMKSNIIGTSSSIEKGKENIKKMDKQELFEKIKNLRKIASDKQKKINNAKNKISSNQNLDDSSDESAIIEISEDESEEKPVKKMIKDKKPAELVNKNQIILIKSDQYAEPEFFNDYMVELGKTFKNVKCIEIQNCNFPKLEKEIEITDDNSDFTFSVNNDEQSVQLEHGIFTIKEIINTIQEVLNDADINLKLSIVNNKINIEHTENEEFILINNSNSILRELGFREDTYDNETKYTAEDEINNINKIYMFIDNISSDEPIGIIDLNKQKSIKKEFKKPINELKEIIVKFKLSKDDDELVDFYKKPHQFNLKIN